jgi:hypothetical protein
LAQLMDGQFIRRNTTPLDCWLGIKSMTKFTSNSWESISAGFDDPKMQQAIHNSAVVYYRK